MADAALTQTQRALVDRYVALARKLASRFAHRYPGVDPDDLGGVAYLALAEAAQRYDAGRGTTFGQFAGPIILGALRTAVRAHYADRLKMVGPVLLLVQSPGSHEADVDSDDAFEALVASAPAKYQDVLWLTFRIGLTQAEVAARIGCSQPYVNRLLREALMCLAGDQVVSYRPRTPRRDARHA